ncbi:hypothetical protein [Cereibacter johrii]|uniref:hypothetical protein n=1 Tax=Cereibacter johrii TaxID=445629 RepID=UPI003CE70E7A
MKKSYSTVSQLLAAAAERAEATDAPAPAEAMRECVDLIVQRMASMLTGSLRAPLPMVLDRVVTWAAAQAVSVNGATRTAEGFRQLADQIERGAFAHLEPGPPGSKH